MKKFLIAAASAIVLMGAAPTANAHFIGELNAKGYADSALWSYGNSGWNWATVSANAGQGSRLGDHSYLFYNSWPWALRRREYVVPPRDWCYAAYVKVTHTSVAFTDVRSKARCP